MNKLQTLISNKHTTGAAFVFIIAKGVSAQWPQYAPLCDVLMDGAIAYGLAMAGDAKPINGHSGDTANETPTKT